MKIRDKYKAWVAATVSFSLSLAALNFGFDIPVDQVSPWVTSAIVSGTSGYLTWLVPNMPE